MLANFHTHTTFCDGKNTPEEIVRHAIEKGFSAIGFSGHCRTEFDLRYCMKDTAGYIREINRLKEAYQGKIRIFLGVEEDAFAPVNRADFDYIIGSAHYLHIRDHYLPVDSGPDYFEACVNACDGNILAFVEHYYKDFCAYILKRKPDVIGHFDLITKYDELQNGRLSSNSRYWEIAEKYMRKAMESDAIFEVNSGGIARGLRTSTYPCERLLRLLKKQDGKVILSSDSHNVDTLGFYFAEIKQLLRDVGFQYTYTLGENGFEKVAL